MANAITKTILNEAKIRKRKPNIKELKFYMPHSVLEQTNFEERILNENQFPPIIKINRYKKKVKNH